MAKKKDYSGAISATIGIIIIVVVLVVLYFVVQKQKKTTTTLTTKTGNATNTNTTASTTKTFAGIPIDQTHPGLDIPNPLAPFSILMNWLGGSSNNDNTNVDPGAAQLPIDLSVPADIQATKNSSLADPNSPYYYPGYDPLGFYGQQTIP